MKALPYTFDMARNARSSMQDAGIKRLNFVFRVMDLFFTKLSRCRLYNFVPVNQLWNRTEPFARQKDASSKKGVVGSTGRTTPTAPIPMARNPKTSHTKRSGFFFRFFIIDFLSLNNDCMCPGKLCTLHALPQVSALKYRLAKTNPPV